MAFLHEYPYTDIHELNLDWIIKTVKDMLAEWKETETKFDTYEAAWLATKEYINNYFATLDVQEEVNNKIDILISDGTFSTLLAPYVREQSSPIVVDSLTEMTDHTKLYVLSSSGVMYYYNSTTQTFVTSGVVYGELNQLAEIKSVLGMTSVSESVDLSTAVTGGYVNSSGIYGPSSGYSTFRMPLQSGATITLYGYGYRTNVAMIARVNSDNTYTPLVVSDASNVPTTYAYTADTDINIILSYANDQTYYANLNETKTRYDKEFKDLRYVENIEKANPVWNSNQFINANLEIVTGSGYVRSNNITLKKGDMVFIYGFGYQNNVSILTKMNDATPEKTIIISDGGYKWYTASLDEDGDYSVSTTESDDVVIYIKHQTLSKSDLFSFSMFQKFGVVGDSYASGGMSIVDSQGTIEGNYFNLSWGQVMARNTGTECVNYSYGGMTTRDWLTSQYGYSKLMSTEPQDLYICALGINDANLGINYLGTIADIKTDYTQNPDTFYGNYGKIIALLKIKSPTCKIIMSTMANDVGIAHTFNVAIEEIAAHFGMPCIYQNYDIYFTSDFYLNNIRSYHPVAMTYSGMAKALQRMIEECVIDNQSYFLHYQGTITPM